MKIETIRCLEIKKIAEEIISYNDTSALFMASLYNGTLFLGDDTLIVGRKK